MLPGLGVTLQANSTVAKHIGEIEGGLSASDRKIVESETSTELLAAKRAVRGTGSGVIACHIRILVFVSLAPRGVSSLVLALAVQLDELKSAMRGLKKTDRRTLSSRPDLCRSDYETQRKRFTAAKEGKPTAAAAREENNVTKACKARYWRHHPVKKECTQP
jgi:hypothetical protein